jgi:hypothetical protein
MADTIGPIGIIAQQFIAGLCRSDAQTGAGSIKPERTTPIYRKLKHADRHQQRPINEAFIAYSCPCATNCTRRLTAIPGQMASTPPLMAPSDHPAHAKLAGLARARAQ